MKELQKQTFILNEDYEYNRSSWMQRNKNPIQIIGEVTKPYRIKLKGKPSTVTQLQEVTIFYKEEV